MIKMKRKNNLLFNLLIAITFFIFVMPPFSSGLFNSLEYFSFVNEQTKLFNTFKEKNHPSVVQAEESTDTPRKVEEEFTPNTSNLHPQWNHNMMNIGQAWADGYTGAGISIAVLDTGFFIQHPDSSIIGGYSVFADDPWSNDHSGHGTHISGIISAQPGSTYQGIAPDAEVFGIKIYHEDDVDENGGVSTNVKSVISGIEYAMDIEVDIIVISSGLSYDDPALYKVIKAAHNQGIMIIAASGNGKSTVNYPANYEEVIAVTAVDEDLNPALDIIYGKENEFSAPGVNIGGLSIPDSSYSYPYIFMSGSSQAAPHAAGLAAILMQKYETRGENIRKIMQKQALDIGDPGLFGHGLLQYVSDEDSKNNELVPVEEPESEDDESTTSDDDEIIEEEQTEQENQEELKKPASSREADVEETENNEELVEFYQTDIIPSEELGTLEKNILALVEDKGSLQINMNDMQALFLTENQISQIRDRNISIVLAKEEVSWTIPPANLVPGEAILRFYEGAPVGVERYNGASKGLQTISIYQQGTRHDAYPSGMKVSYNLDYFNIDDLLSLRACYWDKKEAEWLDIDSDVENGNIVLQTKHTTAVGFLDPDLIDKADNEENTENNGANNEEESKASFLNPTYGKILISLAVFILLLVGAKILTQKNHKKRK